jgi:hypothetical protein
MGRIHHVGPTRAAKLAHPSSPLSAAAKWARVPVEPTCRPHPSVRPHLSRDFSPISPARVSAVVIGNPPLPRPVPSPSMPTDVAAEPPHLRACPQVTLSRRMVELSPRRCCAVRLLSWSLRHRSARGQAARRHPHAVLVAGTCCRCLARRLATELSTRTRIGHRHSRYLALAFRHMAPWCSLSLPHGMDSRIPIKPHSCASCRCSLPLAASASAYKACVCVVPLCHVERL